jgi:exopolyphosphatase/pppGpp-phosphohydrolase
MTYLEITEPLRKVPVADADAVCAVDMGSRIFALVCGYRLDNRIVTKTICNTPLELGADITRNRGRISDGKLAEIRAVLSDFRDCSRHLGVSRIIAAATAGVGRAANARVLPDLGQAEDIAVELMDEQREGELGYLAATGGKSDRLVCKLRSHSCQVAWKTTAGTTVIYLDTGYVKAYEDFISKAYSIGEATDTYREFLKRHIRLPAGMQQLIALSATSCASFITGLTEERVRDTALPAVKVAARLDELQGLLTPEFEALKRSGSDMAEALSGLIFLDCLLSRTGHTRVVISGTDLPMGLIHEYFASREPAGTETVS